MHNQRFAEIGLTSIMRIEHATIEESNTIRENL
jgi:hypothetical protein